MSNKSNYQYQIISSFGPEVKTLAVNNPLSYCLSDGVDNSFMHGGYASSILNRKSEPCQNYFSEYCSNNWDEYCEMESKNQYKMSNSVNTKQNNSSVNGLNAGEVLIYNTAIKKYIIKRDGNCQLIKKQFDPTVGSSPFYSTWISGDSKCASENCENNSEGVCVPIYGVQPSNIDSY